MQENRKTSLNLPIVDLKGLHIKSAKNIVIKSVLDSHNAELSRVRFITGPGQDNTNEDQVNLYKIFPRLISDSTIRHLIKSCVKYEDSYVVILKIIEERSSGDSTSASLVSDVDINVNVIKKDAANGDPSSQFILGLMHLNGDADKEQSTGEALKWLTKAAKRGEVNAQLTVGKIFYEGKGVTKNVKEAHKWFKQAAQNNNSEAQYILGQMYLDGDGEARDVEQACRWLKESSKHGDSNAQLTIGNLLYEGKLIKKDVKTAVTMFKKAAKQNNVAAQMIISDMYSKGEGVWKNDKKALKWISFAAEQGNPDAQFILGRMYARGKGTNPNLEEALKWFGLAAEQGHLEAGIISETFSN